MSNSHFLPEKSLPLFHNDYVAYERFTMLPRQKQDENKRLYEPIIQNWATLGDPASLCVLHERTTRHI